MLEQELHICNHPTKTKNITKATLGELPCFKPCRDSYGLPFLAATRGFGSSLPAFKQNPTVTTSGDDCAFQSFHWNIQRRTCATIPIRAALQTPAHLGDYHGSSQSRSPFSGLDMVTVIPSRQGMSQVISWQTSATVIWVSGHAVLCIYTQFRQF